MDEILNKEEKSSAIERMDKGMTRINAKRWTNLIKTFDEKKFSSVM